MASVPTDAVDHLAELVVAERRRLDHVERTWSPARTWALTRDRAVERLAAEAAYGLERSARTLDALIQASYDVEFVQLVAHLEEPDADG